MCNVSVTLSSGELSLFALAQAFLGTLDAFTAICSSLHLQWQLMILGFWCFSEENRNSILNSSLESVISSNVNSFLNSNSAPQPSLNSSDLELEVIKPNRPNSL